MDVTSHPVSPVQAIGSNVTLTCAVELSPAVDVPVTVNTVWTGPAGFMSNATAQPVTRSAIKNSTYTSTATVMSFSRNKSGDYICRATVIPQSTFVTYSSLSGIKRITAGMILLFLANVSIILWL